MKGQAVFEFVIASIMFFGIMVFIIMSMGNVFGSFTGEYYSNVLQGQAVAVSELILKTPGNWSGETPLSVGLSEGWPVLNSTRIAYLNALCNSDYTKTLDMLDIESKSFTIQESGFNRSYNMNMTIINMTSNKVILDCGKEISLRAEKGGIKRFGVSNTSDVLVFELWLW